MASYLLKKRLNWSRWVTPKPLGTKPIHRWYVFPHSFTSELVHQLISDWGLGPNDHILDPFAGAGTTLLAAKEKGVPATGYDLSPLAVLAARTKVTNYQVSRIRKAWKRLKAALKPERWNGASRIYPELVQRALPGKLLGAFDAVATQIAALPCSAAEKEFFQVALLRSLPKYSRATATGGWLKWMERHTTVRSLPSTLAHMVEGMIADLEVSQITRRASWRVRKADARRLPDRASTYTAVITSPPYPNRHDYTRVFGVELMLAFLDWEQTRKLRYQSFHSHPEAYPQRPDFTGYRKPRSLADTIARIRKKTDEPRLPRMLEGFFLDMYLCLREVTRVCKPGAKVAVVVGNAQYCGQSILVDELTARIGEKAGLKCDRLLVARYRGNSAQQMGAYGRNPSRESVVLFHKPKRRPDGD
jgi:site-specific DNA-methyltransferase (cytosine-N4-specific)